jgi:hypothetical protein
VAVFFASVKYIRLITDNYLRDRSYREISVFAIYAIYASIVWGYIFSKCSCADGFVIRDKCLPVGDDEASRYFLNLIGFLSANNQSNVGIMITVSVAVCLQLISVYLWLNFVADFINNDGDRVGIRKVLSLSFFVWMSNVWIYFLFDDYMLKSYVLISALLFFLSWGILDKDYPSRKLGKLKT